jgi:purine-binding chemotaxis protein CheW
MSDGSLSRNAKPPVHPRSGVERRKSNQGPPDGVERRVSDADRRAENNEEFVSFFVAGQLLGLSVRSVQEVLPYQPMTRVPLATAAVAGLLNLRGQIVTVIDLRKRLGLPDRENPREAMHVIVQEQGEFYSLLVDSVGDVMSVARSRYESSPPTLDAVWRACCKGVYRLHRGLLVIVDVPTLIGEATVS